MSIVINQSDESEVAPADVHVVTEAYARYKLKMGCFPSAETELSEEQMTALHAVLERGRAPYCDFAVWGPFHQRILKRIRMKGVRLSGNGELSSVELCGPDSFHGWKECYAVSKRGLI